MLVSVSMSLGPSGSVEEHVLGKHNPQCLQRKALRWEVVWKECALENCYQSALTRLTKTQRETPAVRLMQAARPMPILPSVQVKWPFEGRALDWRRAAMLA